jgi:hypothetical protein
MVVGKHVHISRLNPLPLEGSCVVDVAMMENFVSRRAAYLPPPPPRNGEGNYGLVTYRLLLKELRNSLGGGWIRALCRQCSKFVV